jgi:NTE family protein
MPHPFAPLPKGIAVEACLAQTRLSLPDVEDEMALGMLKRMAGAGLVMGLWSATAAPAMADCWQGAGEGPRVALVLSGGGALAATQVGAIKVLEEAGVPVHCVLGTSMGAVVGALYAAGYDSDKLKEIFIQADWNAISTGSVSYRDRSFRTKEEQRDFFSDYVVGINERGLVLPSGVSSLRGMRLYLRHWLDQLPQEETFDNLPIPYRAIATNLETGDPVTLSSGDVVDSALASMAVPGLYPAQRINGMVLIDGGMSKQMPVDVARQMGADIIIAIDTTIEPAPLKEGDSISAVDTTLRLVDLQVQRNWKIQRDLLTPGVDVHIRPDITGLSTYDFDKVTKGYERGRQAALAFLPRLKEIAATAAPIPLQLNRTDNKVPLAVVKVDSNSGIVDTVILNRIGLEPGDSATRKRIQDGLDSVYAMGVFEDVDYRMFPGPQGAELHILTDPSALGPNLLSLGAKMSTSLDGDATYEILAKFTRRPMNRYGGRLSALIGLGSDNVLDLVYNHPLGGDSRIFLEGGFELASRRVPISVGDERVSERLDQTIELRGRIGREFGQWGLASFGGFASRLDSDVQVGQPITIGAQSGDYLGLTAQFAADTMNSPSFPTSGIVADLRLSQFYAQSNGVGTDGLRSELELSSANTWGPVGAFFKFEAGDIDQQADGLPIFQLGGFKRLSGFLDYSLPATRYGLFRTELFTRLGGFDQGTLSTPIFIGATFEVARLDLDLAGQDLGDDITAGSVYAAINTPLGPAYLAYGRGEGARQALYIFFGRAF